jgi:hypothetical protein
MLRGWLSILLVFLLAFGAVPAAWAGQAEAPKLKIVILEGEGAINNARQRTAREPIVEVRDENNRPVAGAVVLFSLPDRGASGVFANGQTSMAVTTDAQGRAVATGLRPNNVSGTLQIRVDASYQGQKGNTTINQTNALATAPRVSGKTIGILLALAGGAAGGAIAATRGGKAAPATPATPTLTLTAGTPGVSPPR